MFKKILSRGINLTMALFPRSCIEVKFCDANFTNIKTVCLDCREFQPTCKNLDVPPNTKIIQLSFATDHNFCAYSVDTSRMRVLNEDADMIECDIPALRKQPSFPEYSIENARLQTFNEWPKTKKQTPAELSAAGFFYTQKDDRVICFCCGGGLYGWEDVDNPWEQHKLYYAECEFLRLNLRK